MALSIKAPQRNFRPFFRTWTTAPNLGVNTIFTTIAFLLIRDKVQKAEWQLRVGFKIPQASTPFLTRSKSTSIPSNKRIEVLFCRRNARLYCSKFLPHFCNFTIDEKMRIDSESAFKASFELFSFRFGGREIRVLSTVVLKQVFDRSLLPRCRLWEWIQKKWVWLCSTDQLWVVLLVKVTLHVLLLSWCWMVDSPALQALPSTIPKAPRWAQLGNNLVQVGVVCSVSRF